MKTILILGACGQIAQVAIDLFLSRTDYELKLYARNSQRLSSFSNNPRIEIIDGDVLDVAKINPAMIGVDVVYANLSGRMAQQARVIIDAMYLAKVKRIIFISSMGIYDEVPGDTYRNILDPYRDSAKLIEESTLDYTIIRPAWLNDKDEIDYDYTQKGEIFKNPKATVSRKSVADLAIKLATIPNFEVHKSLGVHKTI